MNWEDVGESGRGAIRGQPSIQIFGWRDSGKLVKTITKFLGPFFNPEQESTETLNNPAAV
jgi:hypothetical protein